MIEEFKIKLISYYLYCTNKSMVLVELCVASIDMQKEPHQNAFFLPYYCALMNFIIKKIKIHFVEIFLAIIILELQ